MVKQFNRPPISVDDNLEPVDVHRSFSTSEFPQQQVRHQRATNIAINILYLTYDNSKLCCYSTIISVYIFKRPSITELIRTTVWVRKIPPPPEVFWHFFPNSWEFLVQILHAYYTFLSMLQYKFLFNYLQLWRSYAILSATTQQIFTFH